MKTRAPSVSAPTEFYGSDPFLDDPIENVIRGRRESGELQRCQKRQAVNRGMLRVLCHWSKFCMTIGADHMISRLIDEAWAVYVG